ncbi:hypothetical protein [Vibrio albus]|uniref:hypothetical protein n=1 Tax=Vibrio albus TaxID=2200953 RepID=UPI0011B1D149|nr:hypothetical protein [Vibrio albus]
MILITFSQASAAKTVLILLSGHKTLPWTQSVVKGIEIQQAEYREKGIKDINVYIEYLNLFKHPQEPNDQRLLQIEKKYAQKKIDLILTEGVAGSVFVEKTKDFYPKESRYERPIFMNFNTAGVGRENSFDIQPGYDTLLEIIHRLMPSLQRVIFAGSLKNPELIKIRQATERVLDREPEFWTAGFSREDIESYTRTLTHNDVIVLQPRLIEQNSGRRYVPHQVAEVLSEVSKAPIFTRYRSLLGSGIAGGYLLSGLEVGKTLIKTAHTPTLNWPQTSFNICEFDKSALEHWRIDISRLPDGSELINDPDTGFFPFDWESLRAIFSLPDHREDELDQVCRWHKKMD